MSSPAPSQAGGNEKKPLEQITFRFCSECSNMLYPKEDEAERKLLFTCRTCSYSEEAQSSCIFRNVLNNAAGETAGVTQDVGSDPTVGATSLPFKPPVYSSPAEGVSWFRCALCRLVMICDWCDSVAAFCENIPKYRDDEDDSRQSPSNNVSSSNVGNGQTPILSFAEKEDEDEMLGSDPANRYNGREEGPSAYRHGGTSSVAPDQYM